MNYAKNPVSPSLAIVLHPGPGGWAGLSARYLE